MQRVENCHYWWRNRRPHFRYRLEATARLRRLYNLGESIRDCGNVEGQHVPRLCIGCSHPLPELKAYWEDLAHKYSLHEHIVLNSEVIAAEWNSDQQYYSVTVKDLVSGMTSTTHAHVLVSATGILHIPNFPRDLNGIHNFKGQWFHSARWDHNVDLQGKRVAVIGNGASASQFVPVIAQDSSVHVVNFCRTPSWFLPRPKRPYSDREKWVFSHVPFALRFYRNVVMFLSDAQYLGFMGKGKTTFKEISERHCLGYMKSTAPAKYHEKLTPDFPLGCKRLIVDSPKDGYLAALHLPNMTIKWDGIAAITEDGIITQKGESISFDVIILATGFRTNEFPFPLKGRTGETIQDYYRSQGGATAYLGTTVPGFPNHYIMSGPNTVTSHASVIFTEEVQVDYCMKLIKPILDGSVTSFEVTAEASDAYNKKIQAKLTDSIYAHCTSWYRVDGSKKLAAPFPGPMALYWWLLRRPKWEHYRAVGAERWLRQRRVRKFGWYMVLLVTCLTSVYMSRALKF
ncbi:Baeyer-Villiger monooxygenase [Grifola frondosa]|uniref:Baeyer-Villiger monooxygenase n=1 Tax=Grifola frondosa TaxID=5627 RepID=A0A1C7MFT6_GRIFR|nr:Baeyer-Villiger monooxygenase [Grifola frondosa]